MTQARVTLLTAIGSAALVLSMAWFAATFSLMAFVTVAAVVGFLWWLQRDSEPEIDLEAGYEGSGFDGDGFGAGGGDGGGAAGA